MCYGLKPEGSAMVTWPILFEACMEAFNGLVALAVGYYAFRGYRLFSSRNLFLLHLSFILQGAGMLTHSMAKIHFLVAGLSSRVPPKLIREVFLSKIYIVYFATLLAGYLILIYAHLVQSRKPHYAIFFPLLREYAPETEAILFLASIVLTGFSYSNYGVRRDRNSLFVFLGFLFISLSHLILFAIPNIKLIPFSTILRVAGFLCFLSMLVRVKRAGTAEV